MYILFDIGGTNIRLAIATGGGELSDTKTVPTPQDFNDGVEVFSAFVREYVKDTRIQAAGGGAAGPLDAEKTMLINSPNLPGWRGKPLKAALEKVLGVPVYLENDVALAGLGEALYGVGKGVMIIAYIRIGTGVGGVRIVNGRIDENVLGFEPGHQVICFNGEVCGCGGTGHLEAYISGTAIEKRYHKKPYEITDKKIWDELAKFLAYGLNNVLVHWSPDVIVLGGSMMKEVGIPIERTTFYLKEIVKIFPVPPSLKKAQFEDSAGLWGGLVYLKQKAKGDRL